MNLFKKAISLSLSSASLVLAGCAAVNPANQTLLPASPTTYTTALPEGNTRPTPIFNDTLSSPGCYVACYAHTAEGTAYRLSDAPFYVAGAFRLPGQYIKGICTPFNAAWKQKQYQQAFCASHFPTCQKNECWMGGDTGGWVGASYTA